MIEIGKKNVIIKSQGGIDINAKDNKTEYELKFGQVNQDAIPSRPYVPQYLRIGATLTWREPVLTVSLLPTTGNIVSDVRVVENGGTPAIYICVSITGAVSDQWKEYVPVGASSHNLLFGLQGGAPGQYYHLTAGEYADKASMTWTTALVASVSGQINEHNELGGKQGGGVNEFYHLNASDYNDRTTKTYVESASANAYTQSVLYTDTLVAATSGYTDTAYVESASANAYLQSQSYTNSVSSDLAVYIDIRDRATYDNSKLYAYALVESTSGYTDTAYVESATGNAYIQGVTYTNSATAEALLESKSYTNSATANLEHNNLQNIDGGTYHLSQAQYNDNATKTDVWGITNAASGEAFNQFVAQRGAANGVATLDAGLKIPSSQIPAMAITETYVVATTGDLLVLDVQIGDLGIVTGNSTSYILQTEPASSFSGWVQILTPPSAVTSVNSQVGNVSLTTTDIPQGTNEYFTNQKAINAVQSLVESASGNAYSAGVSYTNSATANLEHNNLQNIDGGTYHLAQLEYNQVRSAATGAVTGMLTPADWTTFNNKQDALAFTTETENKFLRDDNTFQPIETAVGGYANNLYFSDSESDVATYNTLTYTPPSGQTTHTHTVNSGEGNKLLHAYIYPYAVSVDVFPSGVWSFKFYGHVSTSAGVTQIGVEYFARHTDNSETTLFTDWSDEINNASDDWFSFSTYTHPAYSISTTDRMGARVYVRTTHPNDITITYYVGDGYGAYINNPNKIRHSQLRGLNDDSSFLHVTSAEKATWNSLVTATSGASGIYPIEYNSVTKTISINSAVLSVYKGANSDGYNIWLGGGGLNSYGEAGDEYEGSYNASLGVGALQSNTIGYNNVAIGYNALYLNQGGLNNIGIGRSALYSAVSGTENLAIGYEALYSNTDSTNLAIGNLALRGNTTGSSNVGIGYSVMLSKAIGDANVAIGATAAKYYGSGTDEITSLSNGVYIGSGTRASANANTNEIAIGYLVTGNGSNTATLGNASITDTYLRGTVSIAAIKTATDGASAMLVYKSDGVTPIIWLNSTTQEFKLAKIGANATGYADQRNSGAIVLEGSNWNGSSAYNSQWLIYNKAASTASERSSFILMKGSTIAVEISSTAVNTPATMFVYTGFNITNANATANTTSATNVTVKNTNGTTNNAGGLLSVNANGMSAGAMLFRNTSHDATAGSADFEIWLADNTAAAKKMSLTSTGTLTLHTSGSATAYANQRSSGILNFESSQWNGSAAVAGNWSLQAITSTTVNQNTLTYKYGSTSVFKVDSTGFAGVDGYLRIIGSGSSTTFSGANAPSIFFQNTNTTVNNCVGITNRNAGSMYTAQLFFRNTSHHATTGSADLELWLANGAAAAKVQSTDSTGTTTHIAGTNSNSSYVNRKNFIVFARGDFPTSYLHKITCSMSGTVANSTVNFEIASGASTNVNALSLNGAGQVGVGGITSMTAMLHLPAGTNVAGTAPVKFTSGTSLDTPEAGTVEFDGSFLYLTL